MFPADSAQLAAGWLPPDDDTIRGDQLAEQSMPQDPLTVLNMSKLLVSLGLVAVCVTEMVLLEDVSVDADYVGLAVMMVSYLYSATLLVLSLR